MAQIHSVCVYCGSGLGANPVHAEAARILGRAMADAGVRLVYGGGSVGLMGTVARAVLDAGGSVTGIIPQFLQGRERPFDDLTELVRSDLEVSLLVAKRAEDILPMLNRAAAGTHQPELEKTTAAEPLSRM